MCGVTVQLEESLVGNDGEGAYLGNPIDLGGPIDAVQKCEGAISWICYGSSWIGRLQGASEVKYQTKIRRHRHSKVWFRRSQFMVTSYETVFCSQTQRLHDGC